MTSAFVKTQRPLIPQISTKSAAAGPAYVLQGGGQGPFISPSYVTL